MKVGMQFDESSAGQVEGINDAGIETFSGNHLGSLAREQGQNSMDARVEGAGGPVEITYELISFKTDSIPGSAELSATLKSIGEFWNQPPERKDDKALRFVDSAKKLLRADKIPVLRIKDRNTTGLRGSGLQMKGDWFNLTKASGVSLKGGGKLGSFGIGKNVFWANSRLRTVFFSTHDVEDNWAFQGVTKLASHELPNHRVARAVGFYGRIEGFAPILKKTDIPETFRPDGVGTDIFVIGFSPEKNWANGLIAAFVENFFVAFHQDLLRVRIGEREISAANISAIVQELAEKEPNEFANLKNFFEALTSPDAKVFKKSFNLIGNVELRLLLCPGGPKRVAMFRGTGMKVFEKTHFRTPLEFAGVLRCVDEKGNAFLRQVEPPSHTAWEAERYSDDPAAAQSVISELYGWMRECVVQMYPLQDQSSLDIPDLEQFLPDDEDEEPLDAERGKVEGDAQSPIEKILEGITRKPYVPRDFGDENATEVQTGDKDGEYGSDSDGDESDGDGGGNSEPPKVEGQGDSEEGWTEVPRIPYRIFRRPDETSKYVMNLRLPISGRYLFEIFAIGDDGRVDIAEPTAPSRILSKGNAESLELEHPNKISNVQIAQAGSVRIEFELRSRVPLSLNAKVFRHG